MISSLVASPSSTPLNIRNLKVSLSAVQKHHVLFFSPVLGRLVVPFAVQIDIPFDVEYKEFEGGFMNNCKFCGCFNPGDSKLRKFCSNSHRQAFYRSRKKDAGFRLLHGRFIAVSDHSANVEKKESVGSASNTHTKVRNPVLNTSTRS